MADMIEALRKANLVLPTTVGRYEARKRFESSPSVETLLAMCPGEHRNLRLPLRAPVRVVSRHDRIEVRKPSRSESRRMTTGYGTDLLGDIMVARFSPKTGRVWFGYPGPEDSGKDVSSFGEVFEEGEVVEIVLLQYHEDLFIEVVLPKA